MALVMTATLMHSSRWLSPTHRSVGHVPGTVQEALAHILKYRPTAHVINHTHVIDYMGWGTGLTEHHWKVAEDDTDPDLLTPPWTPDGTHTPWLTGEGELINQPEATQLSLI